MNLSGGMTLVRRHVTDSDYLAWEAAAIAAAVANGGAVSFRARCAVRCLLQDLKDAGLWTLCDTILPMVGSKIQVAVVPLKGTAPTIVGFLAADWNESKGLTFGSGKYLETGRTPSAAGMSSGNGHLGVYANTSGNGTWIGSAGTSALTSLAVSFSTQTSAISNDTVATIQSPNNKGHFIANAVSGNLNNHRFGCAQKIVDAATSGAIGTSTLAIGALNTAGVYTANPTGGICAGAHFGAALTRGQCRTMGRIWLRFQQAMGRDAYTDVGTPIVLWGDSLVDDGDTTRLAPRLAVALPSTMVLNRGVHGQTSAQIQARMLAGDDTIDCINVLLLGKNDLSSPAAIAANAVNTTIQAAVTTAVAACVAHLEAAGNHRYLVCMPHNDRAVAADANTGNNYQNFLAVASSLAATYAAGGYADGKSRYRDTRAYLIAGYNAGDTTDAADHALDVPPNSLMLDTIHWNSAGATREAAALVSLFAANGW